jgi:hypothetical protein
MDLDMSDGSNAKSDEESFPRSRNTSVGSSVELFGSNLEAETRDEFMQMPQMPSIFMTAPGPVAGLPQSEFAGSHCPSHSAIPSPFMFSGVSQSVGSGMPNFMDEPEKDPEAAEDFFSTRMRLPSRRKAALGCSICKPVRKCHLKGCGHRCVCDLGAPGEKKRQQKLKLDGANISDAFGPLNTMQPLTLMYSGNCCGH